MVDLANTIWRDFVTAGVPSSGAQTPEKAKLRAWGTWLETLLGAGIVSAPLLFDTRAELDADLDHAENTAAWVIADETQDNLGIYRKSGASGVGSWTRLGDLPSSAVVEATAQAAHAKEWASSASPVSVDAGGDGATTLSAKTEAEAASVSASVAQTAQAAAAASATAAAGSANIFDDTTDGLAGTSEGDYFLVPAGTGGLYLRYRHDSGPAATFIGQVDLRGIGPLNKLGPDLFNRTDIPEFKTGGGFTADGDGVYTLPPAFNRVEYNITGRFAVGNLIEFKFRVLTGGIDTGASYVKFWDNAFGDLGTYNVDDLPTDADGFSTLLVAVPASTAYFEIRLTTDTAGTFEAYLSPTGSVRAAIKSLDSQPVFAEAPTQNGAPYGLYSADGVVRAGIVPNGSALVWARNVGVFGSTYQAATYAALVTLVDDLRLAGLLEKFVYLNPRCGDDAIAARVPLINASGRPVDSLVSALTYSEASGVSAGTVKIGVNPAMVGLGNYGCSMGGYFLNDPAGNVAVTTGPFIYAYDGTNRLYLNPSYNSTAGDVAIFTTAPGRITPSKRDEGSYGLLTVAKDRTAQVSAVWRGVAQGTVQGEATQAPDAEVEIRFGRGTSAFDFIGRDMTIQDQINLWNIVQTFQTTLGRQVEVELLA